MASLTLTRQLLVGAGQADLCLIQPHQGWASVLPNILPDSLALSDFWSAGATPTKVILQVLAGGPCLTLLPADAASPSSSHTLVQLHKECTQHNKAAVISVTPGVEIILAPLNVATSAAGARPAGFWGYLVASGAPPQAAALLEAGRLSLVLDLDETLVVAFTAHSLANRVAALRLQAGDAFDELRAASSEAGREAARALHAAVEAEASQAEQDLTLLRQYAEEDAVAWGNDVLPAREERVVPEGGGQPFMRPVLRLEQAGLVFTRINPAARETSMVMRLRPGWEKLRAWLVGLEGQLPPARPATRGLQPLKLRWEVHVCTAAQREYALEAWRLLDPDALLIPSAALPHRLVCVPAGQKKSLSRMFGVGAPADVLPALADVQTGAKASPMPLAVIVDDRADVWDTSSQAQLLQVRPYLPHRTPSRAASAETARAMEEEMDRVRNRLAAVRSNVYYEVNEQLAPTLAALEAGPGLAPPALTDAFAVLPAVRSVSELLRADNLQVVRVLPQPRQAAAGSHVQGRQAAPGVGGPADASAQRVGGPAVGVALPALAPQAAAKVADPRRRSVRRQPADPQQQQPPAASQAAPSTWRPAGMPALAEQPVPSTSASAAVPDPRRQRQQHMRPSLPGQTGLPPHSQQQPSGNQHQQQHLQHAAPGAPPTAPPDQPQSHPRQQGVQPAPHHPAQRLQALSLKPTDPRHSVPDSGVGPAAGAGGALQAGSAGPASWLSQAAQGQAAQGQPVRLSAGSQDARRWLQAQADSLAAAFAQGPPASHALPAPITLAPPSATVAAGGFGRAQGQQGPAAGQAVSQGLRLGAFAQSNGFSQLGPAHTVTGQPATQQQQPAMPTGSQQAPQGAGGRQAGASRAAGTAGGARQADKPRLSPQEVAQLQAMGTSDAVALLRQAASLQGTTVALTGINKPNTTKRWCKVMWGRQELTSAPGATDEAARRAAAAVALRKLGYSDQPGHAQQPGALPAGGTAGGDGGPAIREGQAVLRLQRLCPGNLLHFSVSSMPSGSGFLASATIRQEGQALCRQAAAPTKKAAKQAAACLVLCALGAGRLHPDTQAQLAAHQRQLGGPPLDTSPAPWLASAAGPPGGRVPQASVGERRAREPDPQAAEPAPAKRAKHAHPRRGKPGGQLDAQAAAGAAARPAMSTYLEQLEDQLGDSQHVREAPWRTHGASASGGTGAGQQAAGNAEWLSSGRANVGAEALQPVRMALEDEEEGEVVDILTLADT